MRELEGAKRSRGLGKESFSLGIFLFLRSLRSRAPSFLPLGAGQAGRGSCHGPPADCERSSTDGERERTACNIAMIHQGCMRSMSRHHHQPPPPKPHHTPNAQSAVTVQQDQHFDSFPDFKNAIADWAISR